ncbi:protein of unknown function [Paraburkholderia kururiensis]
MRAGTTSYAQPIDLSFARLWPLCNNSRARPRCQLLSVTANSIVVAQTIPPPPTWQLSHRP